MGLRLGFPALGSGPCQDRERPYTRHHAAPAKQPTARAPPSEPGGGVPRPPGLGVRPRGSICRSCPAVPAALLDQCCCVPARSRSSLSSPQPPLAVTPSGCRPLLPGSLQRPCSIPQWLPVPFLLPCSARGPEASPRAWSYHAQQVLWLNGGQGSGE